MPKKKSDAPSRPDDESPEWTGEDFTRARPVLELVGEVYGPQASEAVAQQALSRRWRRMARRVTYAS
jgi:hypothetical protein